MNSEIEFKRERVAAQNKIAASALNDLAFSVSQVLDDFSQDMLTAQLEGYIYTHLADKRDLVYYCPRPKFFDWLFRRKKKVVFKLETKDMLLDAPKVENTARIFIPTGPIVSSSDF